MMWGKWVGTTLPALSLEDYLGALRFYGASKLSIEIIQLVEQLLAVFGRGKVSLASQSFRPIHIVWKTFQIQ